MYVKYLNGLDTPGSENALISEVKKGPGFDYRNKRHKVTLENLCTRTAQSSRGVRSRRVHKIYYFGLL